MVSRRVIGSFLLVALVPMTCVHAGLISGVTTTSSMGTFSGYNIEDLTNGQGLSSSSINAYHTHSHSDMWLSETEQTEGTLTFDLGGTFSLSDIAIWNYTAESFGSYGTGRGVEAFTVELSTDGGVTYTHEFPYLQLQEGTAPGDNFAQVFSLGGVLATHVKLNIVDYWAIDSDYVGLSEVQFREGTGSPVVPEPSAMVMFGIGALGLFGYSRRRRQISAAA